MQNALAIGKIGERKKKKKNPTSHYNVEGYSNGTIG